MSYLRGPLTRDEIARLMEGRDVAPTGSASKETEGPGGPPVLPPPYENLFLSKLGGQQADLHLLVKHAACYKGGGETVGVSAWPLGGTTAAEALEAAPFEVAEEAVAADSPPGVRYGSLPEWLASDAEKEIEKALRQRLPDKLSVTVYADPVTGEQSQPGETREVFVERLRVDGGGKAAEKLRSRLEKKKAVLNERQEEVEGRRQEKWFAIGKAVLRMTGLGGRRRSTSGVSAVLTKDRLEDKAEARLAAARAEVAELEQKLKDIVEIDPERFQEETLSPTRGGVKVLRQDLVWVY
jgi:hypothetical protein